MKLFTYQKTGVEFLKANSHFLLCDQQGLGKTIQVIQAIKELNLKKVLVVCPSVAKINWQREFVKFGIKASVLNSPIGDKSFLTRPLICSFNFAVSHQDVLKKLDFDLVVIDEAHFLKEPTTKRTLALLSKNGITRRSRRVWALSGTPAPNHAGEIWVWLYTFGLTKLSYEGFISRYCIAHRVGGYYSRLQISGTNTANSPELKLLIKKCSLRRLKKDVLKQLPPIYHNTFYVNGASDKEVFSLNPGLEQKLALELTNLSEKLDYDLSLFDETENILQTLELLSGSVSSLRRYHGFKKIKPTTELISSELLENQYDKIVIFGIHSDVLKTLYNNLKPFKPVILTGKSSDKEKQFAIDSFQNDPKTRVFIGNIHAAGTAITLTAANQVVFIEQDWTPGNNAQAADRCHRIGQTLPVTCRHIAVSNSIDEKITATLARKVSEISTFI